MSEGREFIGKARHDRHWPTVVGWVRHVPSLIGLVADLGGFVVVVLFVGRVVGLW